MLSNLLEYHWPEQLDDALVLLSRADVKTVPLAGGTYLLGQKDDSVQAVVDLRDLALDYIAEDAREIRIGAMTTLQSMVDAPILREFAGGLLAKAAQASSFSRLVRNCATLGGTLGAGIAAQADLSTALAVLDVEIFLRSASRTQMNLSGGTPERPGLPLVGVTFKGKHERRVPYDALAAERRPNELMIEALIPKPGAASGAAFLRVGRTLTDVALINVAALAQVTGGVYTRVRLALGGVNMQPVRLHALETHVQGMPASLPGDEQRLLAAVEAGMAGVEFPADFRASSHYRHESGMMLVWRALQEATAQAHRIPTTEQESRPSINGEASEQGEA